MTAVVLVASTLIGPSSAVGAGGDPPTLFFAGEIADAPSYDHVVLLWDERLDERVVPVATDFTVRVGGTDRVPTAATYLLSGLGGPESPVDPSGTTIMRLDLPADVTVDETSTILIDYQSHGTPLRDLSLTPVADFTNFEGGVIGEPGSFSFAMAIVDADHGSSRLGMVFGGQIDLGSIPAPARFAVTVDPDDGPPVAVGVTAVQPVSPTDVGIGILDLVLATPVTPGDTVSVTYTPGANPIQGRNGGGAVGAIAADALVFLPFSHAQGALGVGGLTTSSGALTAADPVATTIQGPATVTATVDEVQLGPNQTGYSFFGEQVIITTSAAATVEDPFAFRFEIDDTAVPDGETEDTVVILRNGEPVGACTGPVGDAVPTPCVSLRQDIGDGDIAITVLTVAASTWNMAVVVPYAFGGFLPPVDNPPAHNRVDAGRAIPVRFSLGGFRGMSIFSAGSPASVRVNCRTGATLGAIEPTAPRGHSELTYHPRPDAYQYVWKTARAWDGTCRKLLISFGDGSTAKALFDFR